MIDPATATAAFARSGQAEDRAARAPSTDYQTFLRMLTVQMQNQDPLNPIDSADYAVQLATFSGVEQQTRTNQLLETLLSRLGLSGLADLADAVGREALSTAPVAFDGNTPVDLRPVPTAGADRAVLVVRDDRGVVVAREDFAPAATAHAWSGRGIGGAPMPPGRYSFTVEAMAGDTVLSTAAVPAYARVEEVQATAEGPVLILRGGVVLPASGLLGLRAP